MSSERDPNQRLYSMQDLADFANWHVETGKAHWNPGLCVRGLSLIRVNGRGPSLCLLPEDRRDR